MDIRITARNSLIGVDRTGASHGLGGRHIMFLIFKSPCMPPESIGVFIVSILLIQLLFLALRMHLARGLHMYLGARSGGAWILRERLEMYY